MALAAALTLASGAAHAADGKIAGRYAMTLAGLPIGTANLTISLDHGAYKMMASGRVGGLLSMVSDSHGMGSAQGRLNGAVPAPASYMLKTGSSSKDQSVRMSFKSGGIDDVDVDPPVAPRSDRVPVTPADKHGAIDPLSALLVPGDAANASACHRTLPVFDGVVRFDVPLAYSRMEPVQLDGGFSGEAVVCKARYRPIAGHRPNRSQTKFMTNNQDLEYWLVAMPGAPVLVPYRVVVGTQLGRLTISAQRLALGSSADIDAQAAEPN